jgi:plastocyanin
MSRQRRLHALALALTVSGAVVGLAAACGGGGGGGGGTPTTPPPSGSFVVEVRDFAFEPKSITVQPGDTVVWRLVGDDKTHSVKAVGGVFASGFVFTQPGATFTRTFTQADSGQTFEYWCESHQASHMMQGSVRVGQNAPPPDPGY